MDSNKAHYVVVTGIIVKDRKFLITKRSENEKAFPNMWTIPGGKLELNDYKDRPKDTDSHWYNIFENLLRREVREETGLEIKNIKYLTSLCFIRPDNVPVVITSLFADHHEGEVKLNKESVDYAWVSLEEARNYDLIEGIYEELEMLDKVLKGEERKEWGKRKKVGLDVDEIIVEFTKKYLDFFNFKYSKNFQFKDIFSYNLWAPLGITKEEVFKLADELYDSNFFDNPEFVEGAKEGIKDISKNCELFIITSRPEHIKERTATFFKKNFPDIDLKIMHSNNLLESEGKSKSDICHEMGVSLIVEDGEKHALECAENGIKVLLFDKPWNKNCKNHENIIRVKNWNEILERLRS